VILHILADLVVVLHLGFILFVVVGAVWVRWWWKAAWIHLPAVGWALWIEFRGWICPLTPLENLLRARAGQVGYPGGFVEHYLIPIIYPDRLTLALRWGIGVGVILVNAAIYFWIWIRRPGAVGAGGSGGA